MANFSFGDAVVGVLKPVIKREDFSQLKEGTILQGVVESASVYDGDISIFVEIEDHVMRVRAFDHTIEQAKALIGSTVQVVYGGIKTSNNGYEYVKLQLRL